MEILECGMPVDIAIACNKNKTYSGILRCKSYKNNINHAMVSIHIYGNNKLLTAHCKMFCERYSIKHNSNEGTGYKYVDCAKTDECKKISLYLSSNPIKTKNIFIDLIENFMTIITTGNYYSKKKELTWDGLVDVFNAYAVENPPAGFIADKITYAVSKLNSDLDYVTKLKLVYKEMRKTNAYAEITKDMTTKEKWFLNIDITDRLNIY